MQTTKIALFGAGFIAEIHVESIKRFIPEAEIVAVYSRDRERVEAFARAHGIAHAFTDVDALLTGVDFEIADVCLPNFLHAPVTIAAARAGKHVIIEKPLCVTLEEADAMIEACRAADRKLMYAEQLCFAPKYERTRQLIAEGAIGDCLLYTSPSPRDPE